MRRYITRLKNKNKLIAAQPLVREGCILSKQGRDRNYAPADTSKTHQVGYYHVPAADMDEA